MRALYGPKKGVEALDRTHQDNKNCNELIDFRQTYLTIIW